MKDVTLITGCARSGTSMVAGVVNLCGAFGGDMSGPNKNNSKGMFENAYIRNNIVKPYLRKIGVDSMGQYPVPDTKDLNVPINWQEQIEGVIQKQGYTKGPWFYKGAKMCLMWPVWHYAFPNAKWIIVRRRSGDIVNSCLKTGFMRAFSRKETQRKVGANSEKEGWLWWIRHHETQFVDMIQAGLNVKIVWPERMVTGDYQQMCETLEWLGLPWRSEVTDFIEPKLWKSRRKL